MVKCLLKRPRLHVNVNKYLDSFKMPLFLPGKWAGENVQKQINHSCGWLINKKNKDSFWDSNISEHKWTRRSRTFSFWAFFNCSLTFSSRPRERINVLAWTSKYTKQYQCLFYADVSSWHDSSSVCRNGNKVSFPLLNYWLLILIWNLKSNNRFEKLHQQRW